MFVQVLQGHPHRPGRLRQEWEAVRVGAAGSVAGFTAAGGWVGVLRYPAPTEVLPPALATVVESCFTGPLGSFGSTDAALVLAGSPAPGAGFIQVMQAKVGDRAGWAEADREAVPRFAKDRPDFLGSLRVWRPDGLLTVVDSFTSEAAARAGEAVPYAPDAQALYARWFSFLTDVSWHDLVEPW